ncbi:MAG: SDR family oxidoreductase [Candidatus Methylomirabilis sp.]|nr:SDR family oxidoreductase [Deltaproteobacteria bacterium]
MMKSLVTGGAGFIGSHLVDALVERGHQVTVYDNFYSGKLDNLARSLGRVDVRHEDICDDAALEKAMEDVEVVFHLAAIPSVQVSLEDPLRSNRVNVEGTLKVLWAAKKAGARRVVAISSSAVYGDAPGLPKRESDVPAPLSPYALQKLVLEHYCRLFHAHYGLETVALRLFNVFGPRQRPDSQYAGVIARFIDCMRDGASPTIFGDGGQSRDFVYVSNVVDLCLQAASAPGASGLVVNGGCGRNVTLKDVVAAINAVLGTELQPVHAPERRGEVRDSRADIRLAEERLGFKPRIDFEEGLAETLRAGEAAARAL